MADVGPWLSRSAASFLQMSWSDAAAWLTAAATLAIVLIGRYQLRNLQSQIRQERDSERYWHTIGACDRFDFDAQVRSWTQAIARAVRPSDGAIPQSAKVDRHDLVSLLNYLDDLSNGVVIGFYDAGVARMQMGPIIERSVSLILASQTRHAYGIPLDNYEDLLGVSFRWARPSVRTAIETAVADEAAWEIADAINSRQAILEQREHNALFTRGLDRDARILVARHLGWLVMERSGGRTDIEHPPRREVRIGGSAGRQA